MNTVRGADAATGAKLNPRGTKCDVRNMIQGYGLGTAVGPCDGFVRVTIICWLEIDKGI